MAKKPLVGVIAEFRVTSFDGRVLKGRLLLGSTIEPLVLDGRLLPWADVALKKIRACDRKEPLPYYQFDKLFPPPRADDVITVRPGYWYGTDMEYLLFDKRETELEPDCFEAVVVVRTMDRRVAVRQPIRVVRTDKPPATPGGGADALEEGAER